MVSKRICRKCKIAKPPAAFYDKRGHKMTICKLCVSDRKRRRTTPRYGCELDQIHASHIPPARYLTQAEIDQVKHSYLPPTGRVSPEFRTIERWIDQPQDNPCS